MQNKRRSWLGIAAMSLLGGCGAVHSIFTTELASAGLPQNQSQAVLVSEADLAPLPKAVQRYFHFMGAVNKPKIWSFRVSFDGRFRPGLDKGWANCEAWQYNTRLDLARYFYMTLKMNGLPFVGRDTYAKGKGRMLIKMFDLFPVQDSQGMEMDIGELVTYLNDGILIAPSILLTPQTTWTQVDENSFDVSLTDRNRTVSARVFLDEQGAPKDFSTTDRFLNSVRTRWNSPIESWQTVDGRKVFVRGKGVWHTPDGEFTYAEFNLRPETLAFNVEAGK